MGRRSAAGCPPPRLPRALRGRPRRRLLRSACSDHEAARSVRLDHLCSDARNPPRMTKPGRGSADGRRCIRGSAAVLSALVGVRTARPPQSSRCRAGRQDVWLALLGSAETSYQRSTRSALKVFHRLGVPSGSSKRKWTAPGWVFSRAHRPSEYQVAPVLHLSVTRSPCPSSPPHERPHLAALRRVLGSGAVDEDIHG